MATNFRSSFRRINTSLRKSTYKGRIGLYRPWGFKRNAYVCFYTRNMENHYKAIQKAHTKLVTDGVIEMTELLGIQCVPPFVIYSSDKFSSHSDIKAEYKNLIKRLKIDGNNVKESNPTRGIVPYAMVEICENNHNGDYLTHLLDNHPTDMSIPLKILNKPDL